jgi:hypothetical protein
MISASARFELRTILLRVLMIAFSITAVAGVARAQTTGTISGSVKDSSGAVIPEAAVTVKHVETGFTRSVQTDARGAYRLPALPVGNYEVTAEKTGFKNLVRQGIRLVVAQDLALDLELEVGAVGQEVTVTAEAPLVNTTLSSTAGLVSEKQVKDLPLSGRSFDQLLTLNAGTTDYSSQTSRNTFSVSGRRPDENAFTINGIEYIGTDNLSIFTTPSGISGQMLGVDAVREFNVQTDAYGADRGGKAGGQVGIVTSSGTNQLHGSAFEYLRNNALDSRNFFDVASPRPYRRNQFGGTLGGPIKRDKLFIFGSYEGFRQGLGGSGQSFVPDENARRGILPIGPNGPDGKPTLIAVPDLQPRMLGFFPLWLPPNGPNVGGGTAIRYSDTVTKTREDFGLLRVDFNISEKDFLSATVLKDSGEENTASGASIFDNSAVQPAAVVGLQETRAFSPTVVNVATFGVSRAYAASSNVMKIDFPADLRFVENGFPGSIRIGTSLVTGVGAVAGTGGTPRQYSGRTHFTLSDDVKYSRGNHSFSFGGWGQKVYNNVARVTSEGGAVQYQTLTTMLQDRPTSFQGVVAKTPMGYRMTHAAFYVQDEIRLRSNLTMRIGLRDDMTNGWNEVNCRGSNYDFDANGVIIEDPMVGCSILKENNAKALLQPRLGLAWDVTGNGRWSVRTGWGLHNSIQDMHGFRLTNPPYNGLVSFGTRPLLSYIPLSGATQGLPSCSAARVAAGIQCNNYSPNGVDPKYKTPTVQEWNLSIERQLTPSILVRIGYNGSQGYHMMTNVNANQSHPVVCNTPAGCVSGGVGTARGLAPQGETYLPPGPRPNPYATSTYHYFYEGTSNYHGMDLTLSQRLTHGLSFRANYTFSKALDQNSSPSGVGGSNAPSIVADTFNIKLNKGRASYDITNKFNANFSYELPFGTGKMLGGSAAGVMDKLISGWQLNGIFTARDGLPFTPVIGSNRSGTGDSRVPDVPDLNPAFSGPVILGTVDRWYDPNAFLLPIAGTFGDSPRGGFVGPGMVNMDASLFKGVAITERLNMQFRAEAFNLFNHTNLADPSPTVFAGTGYSPSAGKITATRTRSRGFQFALRMSF